MRSPRYRALRWILLAMPILLSGELAPRVVASESMEKDLLPLIRAGLETAWQRGYLGDSKTWADYHLVAMNTGWEVTGPWDVEMQVAGLQLAALMRAPDAHADEAAQRKSSETATATQPYQLWDGPALPADPTEIPFAEGIEHRRIHRPTDEDYKFLHGAAIVWHEGQFFVDWANSPVDENGRHETLRGRRSTDGGQTWSPLEVIGPGFDGPERHSHGVLFVHDGQVWTICARFGLGTDGKRFPGLQAEAFVLDRQTDRWTSRGIVMHDCWPCDQPVPLANGNCITGGQNKDGLPCVAISQGADMIRWRTVLIPYPAALAPAFAETTVWADGLAVLAVIRGGGNVAWVATSQDGGHSWAEARPSNLPMPRAKAYLGRLSTGQLYLVSNYKNRDTLVISVGKPGQRQLGRMWRLRHGKSEAPRYPGAAKGKQWSYPYAYEHEGKLYVVYSIGKEECGLTVVPISSLTSP